MFSYSVTVVNVPLDICAVYFLIYIFIYFTIQKFSLFHIMCLHGIYFSIVVIVIVYKC